MKSLAGGLIALALVAGCGSDDDGMAMAAEIDGGPPPIDAGPPGIALLGNGAHTIDAVDLVVVATDLLNGPRDLAFDPERPGTVWVVNGAEHSMTIISAIGTPDQEAIRHAAKGSEHFLSHPGAIAFGAPGTFATAQDENGVTQSFTPPEFMGPTLWSSDLAEFDGGKHGHVDMLHNSPSAVGIAWERDNVYWVNDGAHGSLTRYDFQSDHGLGGADHTDGIVHRHVDGQLRYVPNVSSHVAYDAATGLVYAVDSGNNRVVMLDPSAGVQEGRIEPNFDGDEMYYYGGSTLVTVVDGATAGLSRPSGLHLHEGILYVGDHATSKLHAFTLEGVLVDWVDLSAQIPPDSMMGMDMDPEGRLYIADTAGHRIFRLSAR